jgi:predicted PolB exonuclease-like 3'-5' exonuclease
MGRMKELHMMIEEAKEIEQKLGSNQGLKYDENKLRYDLIPTGPLEDLAKVYSFGAEKYGDNNWQWLEDYENRYYAAMLRHIVAWRQGETNDKESKIHHLAHAAWNCFALIWHDKQRERIDRVTSI